MFWPVPHFWCALPKEITENMHVYFITYYGFAGAAIGSCADTAQQHCQLSGCGV